MKLLQWCRYLIPFGLFALIFIFLWRGLSLYPRTIPSPLLNQPVPAFSMIDVSNSQLTFTNKSFAGQICLINVWATWCTTCRAEHPFLVDLARTHQIAIYGIDYKDDLQQARQWLTVYGNPYKILGFDGNGKVSINLGVYGTPETFLLDKHGVIRYKLIGALTPDIWQKKIMPIVEKLQSAN